MNLLASPEFVRSCLPSSFAVLAHLFQGPSLNRITFKSIDKKLFNIISKSKTFCCILKIHLSLAGKILSFLIIKIFFKVLIA